MRSGYTTTFVPDPEPPAKPQTTPIPIQIVTNDITSCALPTVTDATLPTTRAKSDNFYPAWLRFTSVEPRRAKVASRSARMVQERKTLIMQSSQSTFAASNHVSSAWDRAAADCRAKVEAIVEECRRLNKKYRDAMFDLERQCCLTSLDGSWPNAASSAGAPPWVKRVEDIYKDPVFFNTDAPFVDVHQGYIGDCWFLASLISVSAKKDMFAKLCVARDEKIGVYGFVFYRDGEWIYEVVDDMLYLRVGDDDDLTVVRDWDRHRKQGLSVHLRHKEDELKAQLQAGGEGLYFSYCKSNETWLPLIEKAYAKAHGDYYAIEGGFSGEGIEDLTGCVSVVLHPEDIMDKDRFWREQLMRVNQDYLFGGGSKARTTKNLMESHAYAVLEAWEGDDGLRLLKLRNPWGEIEWDGDWSDGSKLWTSELLAKVKHTFGDDGIFWMSYGDFLKHFPAIHRARIFDDSWYTSQQWTSVNVPWTVDYLDTKFEVTVQKRGPVVFVLSQPDDRYFRGLDGRYVYSLHFRVYRSDDTTMSGQDDNARYIVRSMYNSGNDTMFTRSVSAEVEDLEPGRYSVIFKITARRTDGSTADETIRKHAVEKREKLLQVGRRFDYAQMKGNLRGLERANRLAKQNEKIDDKKVELKKGRKRAKKERQQLKRKKLRIEHAKALTQSTQNQSAKVEGEEEVNGKAKQELQEQTLAHRPKDKVDSESIHSGTDSDGEIVLVRASTSEEAAATEQSKPQEQKAENESCLKEKAAEKCCTCEKATTEKDDKSEELEDDDFDWDSDLDAPICDSESEHSEDEGEDPFENDPWNAMCVVGLRVFTREIPAAIEIVEDQCIQ